MITQETAAKFIHYNPKTGEMTWKETTPDMFMAGTRTPEQKSRMFNARYSGRPALNAVNGNGYKSGRFLGVPVVAHRVAWLIVYGVWPDKIDHINGNRQDNRKDNLRSVSGVGNGRNQGISVRNKSGVVGVRFVQSRKRWSADIRVNGKLVFLGRFHCFGEAVKKRQAAERRYEFHENHGKRAAH